MRPVKNMSDEEVRRLSWRCRRGLLELDIVLRRFSDHYLAGISAQELLAFDGLLDLPDNEFLDVVTSRVKFSSVDVLMDKQLDVLALQSVLAKLSGHEEINL
ncbi:MAG: succinate dehydrogenase assembly factor 2 [Methylotenera sp.]|nr:succinate dehydrogenase assembly factor 2 [Methylotenera sp.]MSQ00113.1 succinate dehydrogenase assembly factor 2 [Methylotenera sp.]